MVMGACSSPHSSPPGYKALDGVDCRLLNPIKLYRVGGGGGEGVQLLPPHDVVWCWRWVRSSLSLTCGGGGLHLPPHKVLEDK